MADSKNRPIVLAVVVAKLTVGEAAQRFEVSSRWIRKLLARYSGGGLEAVDARSGCPQIGPHATDPQLVEGVLRLRTQLGQAGLDAGEIVAEHLIDLDRDYQPEK